MNEPRSTVANILIYFATFDFKSILKLIRLHPLRILIKLFAALFRFNPPERTFVMSLLFPSCSFNIPTTHIVCCPFCFISDFGISSIRTRARSVRISALGTQAVHQSLNLPPTRRDGVAKMSHNPAFLRKKDLGGDSRKISIRFAEFAGKSFRVE